MLDPKLSQQVDQFLAEMREVYPAGCRAIFEGCLERGFSEDQSFQLAMMWFMASLRNQYDNQRGKD